MITVDSWGIGGSVVDLGRTGLGWLGQSRMGAVDTVSLALANRLVGNPENMAGLETSGGLVVTVHRPTMVVIAGGVAEVSVVGGPAVGWGNPVVLPAGAQLRVGRLNEGARVYLGIRGGVTPTGDGLRVGTDPTNAAATQAAPRAQPSTRLRVWPGPRLDWFSPSAWPMLLATPFEVTNTSRVGLRLYGAALLISADRQLPSEGLVEGAIQVPPDGQPIIMLADHPTTGGYPVIAVLDPADVHHAAQAAPGTRLRFAAHR